MIGSFRLPIASTELASLFFCLVYSTNATGLSINSRAKTKHTMSLNDHEDNDCSFDGPDPDPDPDPDNAHADDLALIVSSDMSSMYTPSQHNLSLSLIISDEQIYISISSMTTMTKMLMMVITLTMMLLTMVTKIGLLPISVWPAAVKARFNKFQLSPI